ncbi:hypothetical protein ACCO45_009893 [Purpureocillium lilacinum]|uniref:Uncharacterized protein n=2 Tax=Purpureocillium lilacinum TaxID=33203 RepID=A0ACC4DHF0_PURLI
MDISPDGTLSTLREGSNQWTAFPGNENQIGNVPMCCDPMGLQWVMDILEDKPRPTNSRPGLIYMLCGATQHSNVDHTDHESPPIPIGPHYMIIWPFDSKRDGLPNNVRDAGSWVMFDGSPFAYLHVCGSPWEGTAYDPRKAQFPIWSMRYAQTDRETEEDPQAFWWDDLLKKRMKRDG